MKYSRRDFWVLVLMLAVITVLHYFTAHYRLQLHEFYRRLYYLPIIFAAFRFRFRGGIMASCVAAVLYAPHLLFYVGNLRWEILNQLMEIVLFLVIGVVTGSLMEGQHRKQRLVEQHLERITNLENYTHNVIQSMANGLAALDTNLRITVYNSRLETWLGWSEDVRGRFYFDLFPDGGTEKAIFRRVLKTGTGSRGAEVNVPSKAGELPLRLFIQPLFTPGRIIYGLVVIFEDLREVRNLEEQVRRAERLSAVGVMASGIAHEIRNPLAIIKTISENILEEESTSSTREGLEVIAEEITRANRVISELLSFANPVPYTWEDVDFDDLAQEVVQITSALAQQNYVRLKITGEAGALRADREKLKQALVNLVLNAVQAVSGNGNVNLVLSGDVFRVTISVIDDGPGISPNMVKRIFDPFFTGREGGTGLGLAITHRIVEEHGGSIDVQSAPGGGSEFTITLPRAREGGSDSGGSTGC